MHDLIYIVYQSAILDKHVSIFYRKKYDVISQLLHIYAKDPLCVTRLVHTLISESFCFWSLQLISDH